MKAAELLASPYWRNTLNAATILGQSKNPYQADANAPDSIVTGVTQGVIVGARGGWAYDASTGVIWPNTNVAGENAW